MEAHDGGQAMEVDLPLPLSDPSLVEDLHLPGQSGDSGYIQSKSVGAHKHPISRSELKRLAPTETVPVDTEACGRVASRVRKQVKHFEGEIGVRSRLTADDRAFRGGGHVRAHASATVEPLNITHR